MTLTLDTAVSRNPAMLSAELDDQLVLMSIGEGAYYGLRQTCRDIWLRLERPVIVRTLCDDLAREYDAPIATIEADTLALLNHLHGLDLVAVTPVP